MPKEEAKLIADDGVKQFPWHASTTEECIKELKLADTLAQTGLSSEEAAARLVSYGPNQMTAKEKVTLLQKIWAQVANVLVGILAFVAIVSFIRCFTVTETDDLVSNAIQVGLIVFVIT
jgi:magnesium-transporting ATPase (P-type)